MKASNKEIIGPALPKRACQVGELLEYRKGVNTDLPITRLPRIGRGPANRATTWIPCATTKTFSPTEDKAFARLLFLPADQAGCREGVRAETATLASFLPLFPLPPARPLSQTRPPETATNREKA